MSKTWFQHDINTSLKEEFSELISKGGFEAYGRFWAFMELFYTMQINNKNMSLTVRINETTIIKHLQMNRRSLPKVLQMFTESFGIVYQLFPETFGNVYETTIPKSLDLVKTRKVKSLE